MRFMPYVTMLLLTAGFVMLAVLHSPWWFIGAGLCGLPAMIGTWDVVQTGHSICRNYPMLGRLRFLQESIRPELQQYFIETNTSGRPFSRDQRSLVYQRAKNVESLKPFGTELDVYSEEYEWASHPR